MQSDGTPISDDFVPACNAIGALTDASLSGIAISWSRLRQKTCLLIYSTPIFQETATIQGLNCKSDVD